MSCIEIAESVYVEVYGTKAEIAILNRLALKQDSGEGWTKQECEVWNHTVGIIEGRMIAAEIE